MNISSPNIFFYEYKVAYAWLVLIFSNFYKNKMAANANSPHIFTFIIDTSASCHVPMPGDSFACCGQPTLSSVKSSSPFSNLK